MVEALNGVLWVLVLLRYGYHMHTPVYCVLVSALVVITFIDLDHQIIPDRISIPGIPAGILAGSFMLVDPFARSAALGWQSSLAGAALGLGLFYAIAKFSRGGMGGGDIKLMGMLGGFLGWKGVLLVTFSGSILGSAAGLFLVLFRGGGRKTEVPFGPFLAAGALITLFFGQEIMNWYLPNVRG
jgi:leader peptidase (prepilin peptidase)/N-methyltransferase